MAKKANEKMLTVLMDTTDHAELKQFASDIGLSVTALVRSMCRWAVANPTRVGWTPETEFMPLGEGQSPVSERQIQILRTAASDVAGVADSFTPNR